MDTFSAYTNDGRRLLFDAKALSPTHLLLTLPKEAFSDAESLSMFGDFTAASAADDTESGFYLLPRSISMSGDIQMFIRPRADITYRYDKPILSLFAYRTKDFTALVRLERNYKFAFCVQVRDNRYALTVCVDFRGEMSDMPYDDIRAEILYLPADISVGGIAAAERSLRLSRGEITTLKEKCDRPAVAYAVEHPLIRIRMGWKPSPSPVFHQTVETEPDMYTACTFDGVCRIADALLAQGVCGADLQLVGWNVSGHDGRFPQLLPVDERFGGEDALLRTIEYVKARGFAISLHTNLIDSYEIADSFSWDRVCRTKTGKYHQCGHYSGGYAYHVCPLCQGENNRVHMEQLSRFPVNGIHFTDVISIVEPDSCFSKEHPCNTRDGIAEAVRIMRETRDARGAFSSEGCFDFAVPALDYGLYVSFGTGFGNAQPAITDRELPFWELIYHGIMLYNPTSPTINYPIKSPDARLTFIMRGGRPSFYFYSRFRTGGQKNWMGDVDFTADGDGDRNAAAASIAEAMQAYEAVRDLQLVCMTDYEIHDCGIHVASYENGRQIIGNFTDTPQSWDGTEIGAWDYCVR